MGKWAWLLLVIGCGGSSTPGEPLISGSLQGSYDGHAFTPAFGFATVYQDRGLIGLADSGIHCGTESSPVPPGGSGIIISIPALAVGTYGSGSLVQVFRNTDGNYESVGTMGSVDLTTVTATSVVGSLTFDYTDSMSRVFSASGNFEVINCMP